MPPPAADLPGPYSATQALREFLRFERASGALLLAALTVALVWANSPWQDSYERLWTTPVTIAAGHAALHLDLRGVVDDGLMTVFFLVVALEIKRSRTSGELVERRNAVLPIAAAVGGMVVPALLFVAVNAGGDLRGWAIPIATDIAIALGVVGLAWPRLPGPLRVFLLTLAIVDDLGAIAVIVVFYAEGVAAGWLAVAGLLVVAVALARARVGYSTLLVVIGPLLWLSLHAAGVHPTVAGVVLGLLAPVVPAISAEAVTARHPQLLDLADAPSAHQSAEVARRAVSPLAWIEHLVHPWSSLVVVPTFVLANAGIGLAAHDLSAAAHSRVAWGIAAALVVGKPTGILAGTWVATRAGMPLPDGAGWSHMAALAVVGGVGFTVSLFVTGLASQGGDALQASKTGVLLASTLAALAGAAACRLAARRSPISPAAASG